MEGFQRGLLFYMIFVDDDQQSNIAGAIS